MGDKFKDLLQHTNQALGTIHKGTPDTLQAFHQLSQAATKDGALSTKTKELMALAIGVAKQCQGCIGFHTQKLINLGMTKEELLETLGMAVYMGGGPALMYAAEAIQAYEELTS